MGWSSGGAELSQEGHQSFWRVPEIETRGSDLVDRGEKGVVYCPNIGGRVSRGLCSKIELVHYDRPDRS